MTSDDFLINHAYQHVWCAPEQDRQHILRPSRISPKVGARGSIRVLWSTVNLPTQGPRYHVFQFGNIAQGTLGLKFKRNVWTAVSNQMVTDNMVIEVYTERGLMVPRSQMYFLGTEDGNIVVAVLALPEIGDFGTEDLYFRFYSNAFFDRADEHDPYEGIEYLYNVPLTTSQINSLTFQLRKMQERSGHVFIYVNGWFTNDVTTATVGKGDHVELVRDSSVERVVEFAVADLPVFLSELDQKQKYLLHPPRVGDDLIRYRDDQDLFLVHKRTAHIQKGVYYHKNLEDSIRMVTHQDYSIPSIYVDRMCSLNPNWARSNQLTAVMVQRRSGMDKNLVDEAHHIKELYKFDEDGFHSAIMGSEAVVDVWRVEALEKSMYTAMMRAPAGKITRQMVEQAYGYNAITRIVADTPQTVTTPKGWVELPFGLRGESTVYEYDGQGVLLGWYVNRNTQWYVPRSETCRYIEAIVGKGGAIQSTVYGKNHKPAKGLTFRCYVCPIESALPTGEWRDVTDDPAFYDFLDDTVLWKVDPAFYYTAVKMDDTFLTYNLVLDYPDGLLRFSLNVQELRINGLLYNGLVEIPSGLLELWLNGHPLIEGLDWLMNGQEICIINKEWRNQVGTSNTITVRATGFCTKDMERIRASEYGIVENGLLSRNNRWNLRDDKVIRVIADGRIWSRDELSWAEDRPDVILTNVRNGAPYQVTEPLIPLRGLTHEESYRLRDRAETTDLQIENYMTVVVGDMPAQDVNLIPRRHRIYSPFVAKLMHDLMDGFFDQIELTGHYSDVEVRKWCEPYVWLLPYEPSVRGFDQRYIAIEAHERAAKLELNVYHYNFLARAIRVMLNDKVDITHSITIDHPPV